MPASRSARAGIDPAEISKLCTRETSELSGCSSDIWTKSLTVVGLPTLPAGTKTGSRHWVKFFGLRGGNDGGTLTRVLRFGTTKLAVKGEEHWFNM